MLSAIAGIVKNRQRAIITRSSAVTISHPHNSVKKPPMTIPIHA